MFDWWNSGGRPRTEDAPPLFGAPAASMSMVKDRVMRLPLKHLSFIRCS